MLTLGKLFGRSPFKALQAHMEDVAKCVELVPSLFEAVFQKRFDDLEKISKDISKAEHKADLSKNDIRAHLPRSLFLPVRREDLLEILTLQDSIADVSEDIGILVTLKPLEQVPFNQDLFQQFLDKNLETFRRTMEIIHELPDLLEASFGGSEAEKVFNMVEEVTLLEHQVDVLQRKLLKQLFSEGDDIPHTLFTLWMRTLDRVGAISNLSENLALWVRRTLEIK